jgi:hypothetical protein
MAMANYSPQTIFELATRHLTCKTGYISSTTNVAPKINNTRSFFIRGTLTEGEGLVRLTS